MTAPRRVNRGPAAAAQNRAAILAAAKHVLAEDGPDASLAEVARVAGVGSGSLYRHFPTRESLMLATFDDGIRDLEIFAARPEATLDEVLAMIVGQLVGSAAFIALLAPDSSDPLLAEIGLRVSELFSAKLAAPTTRGSISADTSADHLFLAIAMLAALLAKTAAPLRPAVAQEAWELLLRGLRHPGPATRP
ncbi:helix-turn-helix domain-containing protein [Nocardia sp. NPDC005366]|uniref:TetR/AcrR family transcriptional regulator n=1 Tax=Nocardia sp. NPDC005366 TaxID=3156878 RepID=UPI0033B5A62B